MPGLGDATRAAVYSRSVEDQEHAASGAGVPLGEVDPRAVVRSVGPRLVRDGFGPLLMFGLGGVNTEIYKDVAFCILPADDAELTDLMQRIKGYPLLTGYRGQPPRDTGALFHAMKALGSFAGKHPELEQIELNPLLLYEKGLFAVDVRIFSRL